MHTAQPETFVCLWSQISVGRGLVLRLWLWRSDPREKTETGNMKTAYGGQSITHHIRGNPGRNLGMPKRHGTIVVGCTRRGWGLPQELLSPYALRQQGTIYVNSRGWCESWILSRIEEAGMDRYHCCCCCYLQRSFELVQNTAYTFPAGPSLPRVPRSGGGGQLPCERQEYMVHPSLLQLPASLYHHRHFHIPLVPYPSFSLA